MKPDHNLESLHSVNSNFKNKIHLCSLLLWKYTCVHCCCRVIKSYPTLCNPMDCSTASFPLLHYLPEFAQIHVHCADDDIQPYSVVSFSPCPQSFPSSWSFPVNWLFASDGQSIGALASASVLPMNSQG